MARRPTASDWHELYRKAMIEPDPTLTLRRFHEALNAIESRALELRFMGLSDSKETDEMGVALRFLTLLLAGPEEEGILGSEGPTPKYDC